VTTRQVVGSRQTALETALVLRQVVSKARFQNISQLVEIIRSVGRKLIEAQPKGASLLLTSLHVLILMTVQNDAKTCYTEHTVGNTVRRLLHHVREEYDNASKGEVTTCTDEFSIANFVLQGQARRQAAEQQRAESTLVLKENDSDDPDSFARTLKPVVMEAIQDILDELETVYDNIAKSARDQIHSECVPFFFFFLLFFYLLCSLRPSLMPTGFLSAKLS
jgi:translation initiation factor eIF-2B subunit beta